LLIKLATAAAVVIAAVIGAGIVILTAPAVGEPAATAMPGQARTVGALFTLTSAGKLGSHFCTASVVHSPGGDLVITAAHCMSAHSAGEVAFVPDYSSGKMPYGIWIVTRVLVDQAWSSSSDPDDDFAFLVVSQAGSKVAVEQITGGEVLDIGTRPGGKIQVAGYPDGADALVSCVNTVLAYSRTQFVFDCGSPLLAGVTASGPGVVIGVIGGFQQGGDTPSVSYAARFSTRMAALYKTAVATPGS
jgi:V8-like Glu-specific endopeptidase